MIVQSQDTYWLPHIPCRTYTHRMSLLSLPPSHIHSTSPPLHDDEMRQVEEYLADQQAIDAAEHARLLEYLAAVAPAAPAHAADEAVAALTQGIRLLAVPEEDDEEELEAHTCGDSECQGEHVHADMGDYYGISPSYSPNDGQYNYYEQPYIPATPEFD